MQEVIIYTIGSVLLVSALSLIGILALLFKKNHLQAILLLLVAFSAGALLGGAFLHLIPESHMSPLYILAGILLFFILEKIVHWRHCHKVSCDDHPHHLATMNLVGDAIHNLIDGMVIAGSYMVSVPLGITTTIAVILHEIPQEIGDFGILLYSGMKPKKAIFFNFLSALCAIAGAVLALSIGSHIEHFTEVIIPITAGGFIYIASADLIPELHKEVRVKKALMQFVAIVLGIALMAALAQGHEHGHEEHSEKVIEFEESLS
ncbi:MAG: ZIP family metal transporter [Patescibacteria group bacterium]